MRSGPERSGRGSGRRCRWLPLTALLVAGLPLTALADPDGSHPLVDRPFPELSGLAPQAPFVLLISRPGDTKGLAALGEAKLLELVGQCPELHAYACTVTSGPAGLRGEDRSALIAHGTVDAKTLSRLQAARTPLIVLVDRQGLVYRFSYLDHWPLLSAASPRFSPTRPPEKPVWRGWLEQFGLTDRR